jgi:putative transposase
MAIIAQAILTMTGRVTMLSISRWAGEGGSHQTVNRFFATKLAWTALKVKFFRTHLFNPDAEYILVGDETIVSKAGTSTHGLGRFYSGLKKQVIKGLSFFVFSLVNVNESESSPLAVKQIIKEKGEQSKLPKKRKKKRTAKRGRKKGTPNKDKMAVNLSPELTRISSLLGELMKLLWGKVKVKYLALDGHFGHNQAVLMAMQEDLYLISKLRKDVALYEKYEGEYSGYGKPKKYGKRVRAGMPGLKYLQASEREGEIVRNYYQGLFLHQEFGMELNVVIIIELDLKKQKMGHTVLFSNDLELGWEKLVKYYSVRFQIEFDFRDAKQHFGLEDFMNQTPRGVENAANMAFLMILLSSKLLTERGGKCVGINDLKSEYRGVFYALSTLKLVMPKAETILIEKVKEVISQIGCIHQYKFASESA